MATLSGSESGVTADFNLAKAKMSQLDKNALKILTCQEEYQTPPAAISKRPKAFWQGCHFVIKGEGFYTNIFLAVQKCGLYVLVKFIRFTRT